MKYLLLGLFAVSCLVAPGVGVAVGGSPTTQPALPPKSPAARQAIARANNLVTDAEIAYRKALVAAKEQLIKELTDARKAAMLNQNLDEALAIDAVIKQTRAELAEAALSSRQKKVEPIRIEGDWLESDPARTRHFFRGNKVTHSGMKTTVVYSRKGNEVRVVWPSNAAHRYVFSDENNCSIEGWSSGPDHFVRPPDLTHTGKRIQPADPPRKK